MTTTLRQWIDRLRTIVDGILTEGSPPHVHSTLRRGTYLACFPLSCGPCIIWSTLWRLVLCPVQCAFNGPAYMCSNSGCTNMCDDMIASYLHETSRRVSLPIVPNGVPLEGGSDAELQELLQLVVRMEEASGPPGTSRVPSGGKSTREALATEAVSPLVGAPTWGCNMQSALAMIRKRISDTLSQLQQAQQVPPGSAGCASADS